MQAATPLGATMGNLGWDSTDNELAAVRGDHRQELRVATDSLCREWLWR